MIAGDQLLQRRHLKLGLLRGRLFQHTLLNQKSPLKARTLSEI
jgi:hypothetical protein